MKIALVHYRAGLMDGVSLEMEKWKKVLLRMGHDVDIVAGNNKSGVDILIPSIGFENPTYKMINKNCFEKLEDFSIEKVINLIFEESEKIYNDLENKLSMHEIIILNNIWSIGAFLPAAIAFQKFSKIHKEKTFIGHHHDFWWEREYFLNYQDKKIKDLLEKFCPPIGTNIKHVVINSLAKEVLYLKKGINSTIVPNVMDFEEPPTKDEKLNILIREKYNISQNSIVLLQATRITERKAIELSIDLVHYMSKISKNYYGKKLYNGKTFDGNIILAFSGMCESENYKYKLLDKAFKYGIRTVDLYPNVENNVFSFWELYNIADAITYPSILEGWGNQLLEAIIIKKPIVLFEYEVFEKDIKNSGIKYISLGNIYTQKEGLVQIKETIIQKAAESLFEIIFNKEKYEKIVNENFNIAKKFYSLETLKQILEKII
ncbi:MULTISPECIES: mannosylglucosylglycerate synthase [unclassified Thermosipho (in: thermotogales)]|uniref:mannosylglucosylglycerate synthase n=1 Tax=unclassified Thermosipho (in: thermotogales) TaxID=2676525 RepID=UPI000986D303|nr:MULTISPECIES: mannosylglucosylglycerate synthase [unclassified Thermosipho (in: thermotogales)]MBT1248714.1 glycosyl transferase family 1 [Thermosipho sp. 1244]OOC45503.1 glycosyl transferase family 1 [Thermosipho sp. 1223]